MKKIKNKKKNFYKLKIRVFASRRLFLYSYGFCLIHLFYFILSISFSYPIHVNIFSIKSLCIYTQNVSYERGIFTREFKK